MISVVLVAAAAETMFYSSLGWTILGAIAPAYLISRAIIARDFGCLSPLAIVGPSLRDLK